jgi:hypothetical protein
MTESAGGNVQREDLHRLYELQRHIYTIASQIESLQREKRIKEITLEVGSARYFSA